MNPSINTPKWWQTAVFYQIYPRSFADGNGDGIGDFVGMTAKLDYLSDLGIDAVWLSPHYPSPYLDCGYDISDYTGVAPEYGTLDDFIAFLNAAHDRGIRVILDLVLNHTSDQHPWFIESRAGLDNPKRDWYIWRDGQNGQDGQNDGAPDGPPNNWVSIFGGSAWEYDTHTRQYYYHAFLKEQPDLNWRNPEVKQAMWDAVRFWLDLGVDGFRLDAIATIFEHPDLPPHTMPITPEDYLGPAVLKSAAEYKELMRYQEMQPGVHELMQELRALLDEYSGDRVLVGEDEEVSFHGIDDNELHLVFNFPLMRVEKLTPEHIRANQAKRLMELPEGAWPCNTLGNHDKSRVRTHYGDGKYDGELARLHLALMLTLKGTPFLYNGEEIGMSDYILSNLDDLRDNAATHLYTLMTEKLGKSPDEAKTLVCQYTRDRVRTPFQWTRDANGGFSPEGVRTWLPVNPDYLSGINAADQENDPASMLNFYRRMLLIRRRTPALTTGDYHALHVQGDDYFTFTRHDADTNQTCLVTLNFSDQPQSVAFDLGGKCLRMIFSDHGKVEGATLEPKQITLSPFEVLIAEIVD